MTRILMAGAGCLLWLVAGAHAASPAGADPALREWFQSLQTAAGGSCCGEADGHIVDDGDVREGGAGYQVRIDGAWTDVEAEAVLQRVDNPTGQWVVFWSPGLAPHHVYCVVRPAET